MSTHHEIGERNLFKESQAPTVRSTGSAGGRLEEVDSLRGLAALVVFSSHLVILLAVWPAWLHALVYSPLSVFVYGGHQAVILFFILSGFVLYLPFTRSGYRVNYGSFVIKRVCRIYLPYLVALAFVVAGYLISFRGVVPDGISGATFGWRTLTRSQFALSIINHILFIGWYNRDHLNSATWTLAEEMRISLIFPFLAALVQRLSWRKAVLGAILCSTLVSVGIRVTHHRSPLETLHYAALFVLGAVLCAERHGVSLLWQRQGRMRQIAMVVLSIVACSYAPWIMGKQHMALNEEADDWLIALSACVVLVSALSENWFRAFLRHRAIRHFGRTSYGIYLLHLPCLFILICVLWSRISHVALFALSLAMTVALATVFLRYVEEPSIALGKRLAAWRQERPARRKRAAEPSGVPALSLTVE